MSPLSLSSAPRAHAEKRKVPLWAQIQHARHELHQIQSYEAVGNARPKARSNEGKLLAERQAAIVATLEWLQSIGRDDLRAFLDSREAGQAEGGDA